MLLSFTHERWTLNNNNINDSMLQIIKNMHNWFAMTHRYDHGKEDIEKRTSGTILRCPNFNFSQCKSKVLHQLGQATYQQRTQSGVLCVWDRPTNLVSCSLSWTGSFCTVLGRRLPVRCDCCETVAVLTRTLTVTAWKIIRSVTFQWVVHEQWERSITFILSTFQ